MARTVASLPTGSRITDYISLGVIAKFFPANEVREVLKQTQRASVRERDLPAYVSVYVLVAIVRKRLGLEMSLYQILQILSVTLFEKTPVLRALQASDFNNELDDSSNQLILFDL